VGGQGGGNTLPQQQQQPSATRTTAKQQQQQQEEEEEEEQKEEEQKEGEEKERAFRLTVAAAAMASWEAKCSSSPTTLTRLISMKSKSRFLAEWKVCWHCRRQTNDPLSLSKVQSCLPPRVYAQVRRFQAHFFSKISRSLHVERFALMFMFVAVLLLRACVERG
jgi:hypothetical protein